MKIKKKAKNKKIIISIMTVIFVIALYFPYIPKMKALSNVTASNSYGGYTWQIHDTMFDMDGNVTLSSGNISMNLNGHYNGSFTINISLNTIIDSTGINYSNTINNYGFICNGCIINGYDASHLYVSIYDCNYWEIEIIPIKNASIKNWKSILNSFDISSITGWSMTKLNDITATQITTISNTLTSINSNILTTNSRLTTTNTELHNILNAVGNNAQYGSLQSQLYGLAVNSSSENDKLQDIKNKIDGYLNGTIENQEVSIWDLQNDANYSLSQIQTTLNTINNNINDYTSQLNSIQSAINSINTAVQNIDNTIDTISWVSFTTPTLKFYKYDNNVRGEEITSSGMYSGKVMAVYKGYYNTDLRGKAFIERIPFYVYFYGSHNVTVNTSNNDKYMLETRSFKYLYLYNDQNSWDSNSEITLIFENIYLYLFQMDVWKNMQYIEETDIEYWTLLNYFKQYEYNQSLLNAINNINMSVTNTTIQDTTTNINDYNTIYNQVSNVEQNYINEYNTNNTTLQSIINDKKGLPDNIINVSTDIESKMGQLFTVPEFKYLFALIISGCVLLALLG